MTRDEFAKVYEEARPKALAVIYSNGVKDTALAEDAVQEAALYFLERLEREKLPLYQGRKLDRVTVSLFCQKAWRCAQDALTPEKSSRLKHEIGVGGVVELEDLEAGMNLASSGRRKDHKSLQKIEEGETGR